MRDDAIVAYRHPPRIDAESELEALGYAFAEDALLFCKEIVAGVGAGGIDHWTLLPFDTYRDLPIYKYEYGSCFLLLAVEDDGKGDRRVSLVLASRSGKQASIDDELWDGSDYVVLRTRFLRRRLDAYFKADVR